MKHSVTGHAHMLRRPYTRWADRVLLSPSRRVATTAKPEVTKPGARTPDTEPGEGRRAVARCPFERQRQRGVAE